jgi:hypothetical protein
MRASDLVERLEYVQPRGSDRWVARCPAHEDRGPSLSIRQDGDRVLIHCFAGCSALSIVESVGLTLADLFEEQSRQEYRPSQRAPRPAYSARDLLLLIDAEAEVVMLAANLLAAGEVLAAGDMERLAAARARIAKAAEVAL